MLNGILVLHWTNDWMNFTWLVSGTTFFKSTLSKCIVQKVQCMFVKLGLHKTKYLNMLLWEDLSLSFHPSVICEICNKKSRSILPFYCVYALLSSSFVYSMICPFPLYCFVSLWLLVLISLSFFFILSFQAKRAWQMPTSVKKSILSCGEIWNTERGRVVSLCSIQ